MELSAFAINGNDIKIDSVLLSSNVLNVIEKISSDYATNEEVAAVSAALSTDYQNQIDEISSTLNIISSDYLTSTDKTELETLISTVSAETLASANTYADDTKLAKSEFAALSNEIGLSAATAENPVVTKDDIKDLAGAMHFLGAFDSLNDISSANPGDIVILSSTSKEYVYNGLSGEAYEISDWVELGDENIYATKAEVATISAQLTSDIDNLESDVDYLSGQINSLSANYVAKAELDIVSAKLSTDYQGKIDNLESDISYLSGEIGNVAETLSTVSSDYLTSADKTELSNALTALDNAKLAKSEFAALSNQIGLSNANLSNLIATQQDISSSLSGKADIAALNNYLPLSGGTVNGNINVIGDVCLSGSEHSLALKDGARFITNGSDVEIYNGNYRQTTTLSSYDVSVINYSYKNSFLQAEIVKEHEEWGIACTGSKGYCILSVYPTLDAVKLSGDISLLEANIDKKYSYAFGSGCGSEVFEIESIDSINKIVTFKSELGTYLSAAKLSSEEQMIYAFDNDDNALYCPSNPTIGNAIIHNFYANHGEGGSIKAIGKYTHAEGRRTIADNRYAHAEGDGTFAGGIASHAEGQTTKAHGFYSHTEGNGTLAYGQSSHAQNINCQAIGDASTAEGYQTHAIGKYSHSEGYRSIANEDYSFAWSGVSSINPYSSHGEGTFSINPENGLSGFYVGNDSLCSLIDNSSNKTENSVKQSISQALSSMFRDDQGGEIPLQSVDISKLVTSLSSLYLWANTL